ncbi:VWA domain-containing protein [Pseudoalteromonas obscura]|uniref:VWA domain-containing protein n=1 Tax=Pseudoalteromonas obscura TaxID=3048491 RepID=A0ABT7EJS3_9GAMM|nr:VWA domain-containing protein [Pseudoalteromonas sp. P94(2023)]MDK2595300.1 VWA domain-containing protein [Pseudoalteromonas sp. P94(2023)]
MTEFQFIRPDLLWLLLPWLVISLLQWYKRASNKQSQIIAPHLAKVVLTEGEQTKSSHSSWLTSLILLLGILAAAGPSIEKQSVPVFTTKQARVLVMDMSYSMYSTDIAPNRLTQARFKTLDMLKQFNEGDTALVAYAQDAFIVSPLTSDVNTLENLVPSISPAIMPGKGANVLAGIDQAKNLLEQAGYPSGEIVLITDEVELEDAQDIHSMLSGTGYTLHVYGVGTAQGAPISVPEGGFLKDRYGQIVVPKLYADRLRSLAQRLGGKYATYSPDSSDIETFASNNTQDIETPKEPNETLWRVDAGKYLLFVIVPLALIAFRNNAVALSICALAFLPSQPTYAADWQSWFKNTDQKALSAYQEEDFEQATNAQNAALKGAALYKQGQYEQAAQALQHANTAIGQYNLGNALAHLGKLDEAVEAYEQALNLNPNLNQAQENKELLEQIKEQQSQQNQDQSNQDQNQQSSEQQQDNQQGEGQEQQQSSQQNGQNSESQDGQENESEQEQNEQSDQTNSSEQSEQQNQNSPELADKQSGKEEEQSQEQAEQKAAQQQAHPQQAEPQEGEQTQSLTPSQMRELTPEEKEKAQQLDQLLRRVPDDPAILLKNKMLLESRQRQQQRQPVGAEKSW